MTGLSVATATFANSQSSKKRDLVTRPIQPNDVQRTVAQCFREKTPDETLSSFFHTPFSIRLPNQEHDIPLKRHPSQFLLPQFRAKRQARTSEDKGVRTSALTKGLMVTPPGIVASSFGMKKKKSSPCGPHFPGTFHSTDAVRKHTLSIGSKEGQTPSLIGFSTNFGGSQHRPL